MSLAYGSEFCSTDKLANIYQNQDHFPFFAKLHQEGMEYMYKETLTDSERMAKLKANIDQGNHKSETSKPEELQEKVNRDGHYGFAVPN